MGRRTAIGACCTGAALEGAFLLIAGCGCTEGEGSVFFAGMLVWLLAEVISGLVSDTNDE